MADVRAEWSAAGLNVPRDAGMHLHVESLFEYGPAGAGVRCFPGGPRFYLKRSLMKIPVLGPAMRLADFIPVDRDGSAGEREGERVP